jgi:hypothetical protein
MKSVAATNTRKVQAATWLIPGPRKMVPTG